MNITEKIKDLSEKHKDEVIELREYLHENPELDLDLFNTQKTIKDKLDKLGIEYVEMAKTGLAAIIRGTKGDINDPNRKTILLRGDMDALPIHEEADVPFRSKIDGKMHACGHDGHTAGLFGALLILNDMKSEIEGNIKFAFQPGEEKSGGAERMINEGILENPKVDMAFGLHLWGTMDEKKVTTISGPMMASPDEFIIKIIGRGGHASAPEDCVDPVVIAAQVILGLQTIKSRAISTFKPLVLSFTVVEAGVAFNVIPNEVTIKGTARTLDKELRDEIPILMEKAIAGITSAYGATYDLYYHKYYPVLVNDTNAAEILKKSFIKIVGEENYEDMGNPIMGGEDFSYFAQKVPSAFGFVGIVPEGEEKYPNHHPKFNFKSEITLENAKILAQVAFDSLENIK